MKIDAHQHFWKYDPVEYDWIDTSMSVIAKDFLPDDFLPVLKGNDMDGCIAVQARQSDEETAFLINLSNQHSFIKGVVGWVDIQHENIENRLKHFSGYKIVKGFRHVLQGEPDIDFMLRPAFLRGIAALQKFGFVYDILIFPKHLPNACKLVKFFPDQVFVLDHIAKPDIKNGKTDEWKNDIAELAACKNVYCKISGMVTEADWNNTNPAVFTKYIKHVLHCFGTNRVMFGSDWPVCQVAASYEKVIEIVSSNTNKLTKEEMEMLWGKTAQKVYRL